MYITALLRVTLNDLGVCMSVSDSAEENYQDNFWADRNKELPV